MDLVTWLFGALVGAAVLALLGAAFAAVGMGALLVAALVLLAAWAVLAVLAGVARWVEQQRLERLASATAERAAAAAREREGGIR